MENFLKNHKLFRNVSHVRIAGKWKLFLIIIVNGFLNIGSWNLSTKYEKLHSITFSFYSATNVRIFKWNENLIIGYVNQICTHAE